MHNYNYTCIRNGKSVVDYFICPHTCFKHCKRFDIERISSLITLFNLQHLVSERSKIPDHSILIMRAAISPFVASNINQSSSTLENNSVRPPRYRFNSKPDAFMNNNVWKAAMANIIDKIETAQYNQLEIDRRYNDMCFIICKEMDKYLQIKCCLKTQRRNFKISKPYWYNELTQLWKVRVEK